MAVPPPSVVPSSRALRATGRYAYVTVHYEGTSRDDEYVLGIQVLMQSIKLTGTPHDLVVLASESVSQQSKRIFESIGCRVLDVSNIDNPFINKTLSNKNFIYTLNKLHVWNLLEYERVVYLDADNVLIRNADELFLCGHFCAVFMNPCHFHTGLLVVTPDAKEYERLLRALHHLGSFDGADQGFLSSMYSRALRKAPLFIPNKAKEIQHALPKGMRLPVGYNVNHKYFYEQYHWKLFYLRHFASMTSPISPIRVVVESARGVPGVTVGFPIAPVLKPWYWWAVYIMDLHRIWHDIRSTLPSDQERFGVESALSTVLRFIVCISISAGVLSLLRQFLPLRWMRERCSDLMVRNPRIARRAYLGLRLLLVVIAARVAPVGIHRLAAVEYAFPLMISMNVALLVFFAACISSFWSSVRTTTFPTVLWLRQFWIYVAITVALEWGVLWVSSWSFFPNVLWRLGAMVASLVACAAWQVWFFKLALNTEFGGKKERLRSL